MKKINFNKDWHFCLNDGRDWDARIEKWDATVDLPHDFSFIQKRVADAPSSQHGGYFQGGVGKYQKTFKAKKNKKYFVICDGSYGVTDVYINANAIYTNKYGYNSFFVDLSEYLRYDKENEILIRVNDSALPNTRWYSGAGLFRDVFLCECDSTYIHPYGCFVTTDSVFGSCAYMNAQVSVYSDKNQEGVVEFYVYEDKKSTPVAVFEKNVVVRAGENKVNAKFQIDDVKLWDLEKPNMYKIKTVIKFGKDTDTDESVFGVRIVNVDSKRGFMLNGKSIKLRGGCIHHDQGVLGSAVYAETEYRRVAKLKEAGFNAVRLSHNPQSPHLYDACDRLGMLVMDELFDYWTEGKKESDFHFYFADNWDKWTDFIVRRNRCHPSIVMWSTGNEIPQKSGRGGGYYIATDIANKIRSLDTSRPITHALCSLWDNAEEFEKENAENQFPAEKMDYFAKKTAITADTCDIIGYNYLEYRLDRDLVRFPNKVFLNTETFPLCAYTTIKQLLANPRIAGDFVWTAWDYFGETAIGHVEYGEKLGEFMLKYPYHISDCGDINMIGQRKPQSYYREIAWELRRDPYIAVRHPKVCHTPYFMSGWGFYDCERSWAFDGYDGKGCEVYVFADCDEVALLVNGEEIARMAKTENGVYKFDVTYTPGEISAIAYVNGKAIGQDKIVTEGKAEKIALIKEKSYTKGEIVYIDAEVQDAGGSLCTQASPTLTFTVEGGTVMGAMGGGLTCEDVYTSNVCKAEKGRALLAIKKTDKKATVKVSAQGFEEAILEV